MRGVNRITLVGNLGDFPEIKVLDNNVKVARCQVATTEIYRNKKGESAGNTEWHTVLFWNSLAGLAEEYLQKGHLLYIEGRLRYRSYENKQSITVHVAEIHVDSFVMLSKPNAAGKILQTI